MMTVSVWLGWTAGTLLLLLLEDEARNLSRFPSLYFLTFFALSAAAILATIAINTVTP